MLLRILHSRCTSFWVRSESSVRLLTPPPPSSRTFPSRDPGGWATLTVGICTDRGREMSGL